MGILDHISCFSTKLTFYIVNLINVQELYMYGKKCVINRVNNLNTTFPIQNVTFVGYAHTSTNILFLDLVSFFGNSIFIHRNYSTIKDQVEQLSKLYRVLKMFGITMLSWWLKTNNLDLVYYYTIGLPIFRLNIWLNVII